VRHIAIILVHSHYLYEILGNSKAKVNRPRRRLYRDMGPLFKDDINLVVRSITNKKREAISQMQDGNPSWRTSRNTRRARRYRISGTKTPGPTNDPAALEQATNTGCS